MEKKISNKEQKGENSSFAYTHKKKERGKKNSFKKTK
jgi:hypothetical protein